ncbi:MAG: hypothetical protein S0880_13095 [Actinomycetota bacterium]|nr:hypothetical protein [Actinomycetota bacterium]
MDLHDLLLDSRTIEVHGAAVTYRPAAVTIAALRDRDFVDLIVDLVSSWDLTVGGEPVDHSDPEAIRTNLPGWLVFDIVQAVVKDSSSGEARAASAAG